MAKTSLVLFLVLSSFFIALLQCDAEDQIDLARTHRSRPQPRPLRPQPEPQRCKYDGIFQFGDSISDTGNQIREAAGSRSPCAHNPYGQKLIGEPTGRCSNGRLMIDFIGKCKSIEDATALVPLVVNNIETLAKPDSSAAALAAKLALSADSAAAYMLYVLCASDTYLI
ncbi:hypothetical protein IFM89_014749 [Coptis chinensis]|uniref:Uncharacterized protein n=1 Tax=Coptis chinensis TaxID=261450 RepID=A0A835M8Y4_9MAGN|nr:hypothetical protein IFM89_014749 [Coptis chinensis]